MTVKPGMPVTRQAADEALTDTAGVSFVTVLAVVVHAPDPPASVWSRRAFPASVDGAVTLGGCNIRAALPHLLHLLHVLHVLHG